MISVIFLSLLFYLVVAFDLIPYLRGPAPYPPDWQWHYLFVNTFHRIYLPFTLIAILLFIFKVKDGKVLNRLKERKFLFVLVFLNIFFQLSVLFLSRSGVAVLIHRIINPDINGYFTTAIKITSLTSFLKTYNQSVLDFYMHAKGHPPFAVLFFWFVNKLIGSLPILRLSVGNFIGKFTPSHEDVAVIWNGLSSTEKTTAVFSPFLVLFLSSLTIIPLYYSAKILYGNKTALRSSFLYLFLPNVVLFLPLNDVFLPIFSAYSLLFFIKGLKTKGKLLLFLSGLILSFGILFSLTLTPLCLFFLVIFLFSLYRKNFHTLKKYFKMGLSFCLGILLLPCLLLFFFNLNLIELSKTLVEGLPKGRLYHTWILFNLIDFFIFSGIPIFFIFVLSIKDFFDNLKNRYLRKLNPVFTAFLMMILIVNFSGIVRGEVARIWIPFMPIMVLITSYFATHKLNYSSRSFLVLLLLQAIQIIVMQEFWVTLW